MSVFRQRMPTVGDMNQGVYSCLHLLQNSVCHSVAHAFAKGPQVLMERDSFTPHKIESVRGFLGEEFESFLDSAVKRNLLSGIGIGVLRDGHSFIATDGDGIDENSLYEMGSVTKLFTSELLHKMIQKGELRWDDRLESFLPARVHASTSQESSTPITLGDLATHRSGLVLPKNFATIDRNNPNGSFSQSELLDYLQQLDLTKSHSQPYKYSNIGYAALGFALERASGKSYADLLEEEILIPLKLDHTCLAEYGRNRPSVIQGHTQVGRAVPPWNQKAFTPTGALCSTVPDMLRWCQFSIRQMMTRTAHTNVNSCDAGIAMGWEKSIVHDWYFRDGETGGFSTFLGVNLMSNSAVVLLGNRKCSRLWRAIAENAMRVLSGGCFVPLSGSYGKHSAFVMDIHLRSNLSGYLVSKFKASRGGALTVAMLRKILKVSDQD